MPLLFGTAFSQLMSKDEIHPREVRCALLRRFGSHVNLAVLIRLYPANVENMGSS